MRNIKKELNTEILGREIIYLEEVRFDTGLYKRIAKTRKMYKWLSSPCRKSNRRERNEWKNMVYKKWRKPNIFLFPFS